MRNNLIFAIFEFFIVDDIFKIIIYYEIKG